ncbi:MAG: zinc-ribbon domain-containing protein [Nitrospirota bacterium]
MVVICPKCKTRLKIDEGKLKEEGSRFKCPKCGTVLLVKKPAPVLKKTLDDKKILVAHSNPDILNQISSLLSEKGYHTVPASDGIEAMVKTIKELPYLVIIETSLPKIYGFEVCKRLKSRNETRKTKFILVGSLHDRSRYMREPLSLYHADDYLYEHDIPELLIEKIDSLKEKVEEKTSVVEPPVRQEMEESLKREEPKAKTEALEREELSKLGEKIERAKRLARTIISDIYLYNTAKADRAIRNNSFYSDFAAEIKEGEKLYESRILLEVRVKGDFFRQAINDFIENKRKVLL